jgi:putative flippase GtrA
VTQFARYVAVGVLNTAIGYALIFAFMYAAGLSPKVSNVLGYAFGLVVSYGLNRVYTFHSRNAKAPEFVRFLLIFAIAFGANFAALALFLQMPQIPVPLSQLAAGGVYVVTSYVLSRRFVFREPGDVEAR